MEIEISKLQIAYDEGYLKGCPSIDQHPNYKALVGDITKIQEWCKTLKQDWHDRMFRLLWVYNFIKTEGQTRPIDVDKNFRIITGHKRASAMLALGHKTIKVNVVDYEKIGQK